MDRLCAQRIPLSVFGLTRQCKGLCTSSRNSTICTPSLLKNEFITRAHKTVFCNTLPKKEEVFVRNCYMYCRALGVVPVWHIFGSFALYIANELGDTLPQSLLLICRRLLVQNISIRKLKEFIFICAAELLSCRLQQVMSLLSNLLYRRDKRLRRD